MIINLPSISVTEVKEQDNDYHVYATPKTEPRFCLGCGSDGFYGHGSKTHLYMDTPTHGKRVGIIMTAKRYRCKNCGKTTTQECPDISDTHRATKRLITYVERFAMARSLASVAADVGLTEGTIRNIIGDHIAELEYRYQFETPEILGVDEAHLNKTMRFVMTNIKERTIIDIGASREKKDVIAAFERLKNKDKVKYVTMDMWRPYRDAVYACLPKATIVIDKFHVVKMANKAAETARMAIKAELSPEQYKLLKRDKYLIRARRRDLTLKQSFILEGWLINHPNLYAAYEAKEGFFEIFDNTEYDSDTAYEAYLEWLDSIPTGVKGYFSDIEKACRNWKKEIFNYFDNRITNAYTESANNLIKYIYKQGRGYGFAVLRARVLFDPQLHKTTSFKSGIPMGTLGFMVRPDAVAENFGVAIQQVGEK